MDRDAAAPVSAARGTIRLSTRVALIAALGGSPALATPARAASIDQEITVAAAINAVLAGGTAAFSAPAGARFRAFRYGFAGGFVASSSLWAARAYAHRGGPYLVRALNSYGANVVGHAGSEGNPLLGGLRDFAYPLGPGLLSLRDGRPSAYTVDAARLLAMAGGLIAGRLDGQETARLGVPVFRYGSGSVQELIENGETKHNSYGGLFNTIFLYDVPGVSQQGLLAHEFYHVLQDDRALIYMRSEPRGKRRILRWGDFFSFQLDGAYMATEAAALAVSEMWLDHDRRPLEREAGLFQSKSGRRNMLDFPHPYGASPAPPPVE